MARTYADFSALVSQKLQDTGVSIFAAGEINYQIEESLKNLSVHQPHVICVTFRIESRKGSASSTLANNLVDATKSQFVSTDPTNEKVIHNVTDNTWAVVETYTDANTLVLSKDIMASGENYEVYNKRCMSDKQIFIGDMVEYLGIDHVEYPKGTKRNFKEIIDGQVLEIMVDNVDDSDPAQTSSDLEVHVFFIMPHILSQLTDWDGELTALASAGATALAIDGMQNGGTIEQGSEFHLENHRTLYIVTTDVTTSGTGTATLAIYPPLETDASDNDDINFVRSTLKPHQEDILADIIAARVCINKSPLIIQEVGNAISTLATASTQLGLITARVGQAVTDIGSGRTAAGLTPALIATEANAALDKVDAEIVLANAAADKVAAEVALANTQVDSAVTIINSVQPGGPNVTGQYSQLAAGYISTASGYLNEGQGYIRTAREYLSEGIGYLRQVQADLSVATTYGGLAIRELNTAAGYLNQATGYLRRVSAGLSVAAGWRHYQEWGERKLAEALVRLRPESVLKTNRIYTRA